ncbi:MAG: tetratricopeptide repeat protein [Parvibaculaceae bacterium]
MSNPQALRPGSGSSSLRMLLTAAALGLLLSGCQTARSSMSDPITTASTGDASIRQTAIAGKKWRENPGNVELGIAYAKGLDALGQNDEQLKVLDQVAQRNPENAEFLAYYGKELATFGRGTDAERNLRNAIAQGQADWRVYSALGSALDQQGKYPQARESYETALKLEPNQLSVLNNMGMSYMLEGNLQQAESTFRNATRLPGADRQARLRQNLALSVGLQGRFDEAREIASRDLPPAEVEANMAYLQSMLSQPNTWKKLQAEQPQT